MHNTVRFFLMDRKRWALELYNQDYLHYDGLEYIF